MHELMNFVEIITEQIEKEAHLETTRTRKFHRVSALNDLLEEVKKKMRQVDKEYSIHYADNMR